MPVRQGHRGRRRDEKDVSAEERGRLSGTLQDRASETSVGVLLKCRFRLHRHGMWTRSGYF